MRISWLSNAPWTFSGYGNQTSEFLPMIAEDGHNTACLAYYGFKGSPIMYGKTLIMQTGYAPYGQDGCHAQAQNFGSDYMFSLMDVWVLDPDLFKTGEKHTKWVPWFPIDAHPIPKAVVERVAKAYLPIVMSKHGIKMMEDAGFEYKKDFEYVPHGIKTDVFKPYDMMESREEMGLPKDAYIIGMVAANVGNPSRKAFAPQIMAFAKFKKEVPEAILYIHTNANGKGTNGVDLPELCRFANLKTAYLGEDISEADVIFASYGKYNLNGYTPEQLAKLYSSFNVHSLVSMGEGFGIPIIEAQACGCPVIVGDWTAMSELCFSGRKVAKHNADEFYMRAPLCAFQYKPRVDAVYKEYLKEYKKPSSREKAREGALEYDSKKVYEECWKPVLARLESELNNE